MAELLASRRLLVIGHRGYAARAPENTLPSFALAREAGVDLIELDYHHSSDDVPMVIHDATLDRTTDARRRWKRRRIRVAARSAGELQTLDAGNWFDPHFAGTGIPRLDEALGFICDGGVALIERKSGDAATCIRVLRGQNWINRVIVISFDWHFLRACHEIAPEQILGALGPPTHLMDGRRCRRISRQLTTRWLDSLVKTGARLVVWNRHVSKSAVAQAHERGLKVWIYTIDEPAVAQTLRARGVDGLISNDPEKILLTS